MPIIPPCTLAPLTFYGNTMGFLMKIYGILEKIP